MHVLRHVSFVLLILGITVISSAAQVSKGTPKEQPTPDPNKQISIDTVTPGSAARDETVTVTGTFPEFEKILLELKPKGWSASGVNNTAEPPKPGAPNPYKPSVVVKDQKTSFTFVVPSTLPLGQYEMVVTFEQKGKPTTITAPLPPDGTLHIVSRAPIKVTSVSPDVSYSDNQYFEFRILGEGFSPVSVDNALIIEGQTVIPTCPDVNKPADNCVNAEASNKGRELRFWNVPRSKYLGNYKVGVRVGDQDSDQNVPVTFARVGRRWPAGIAAGIVLLIAALIIWVLKQR